jgi:hypothetical protein
MKNDLFGGESFGSCLGACFEEAQEGKLVGQS